MTNTSIIWMVRAGEGGYLIDEFLDRDIIAIGWNELGKIENGTSYEQLKQRFKETYPDDSNGRVNQCVSQIWRFFNEFKTGDKVVTYDSSGRQYYYGNISSNYDFSDQYEYHHIRKVNWHKIGTERDELSTESKNTLGAISTIFEIPQAVWSEIETNNPAYIPDEIIEEMERLEQKHEELELSQLKEDVTFRSKEFIKDLISALSWQDTELLVAGMLKAMGYYTRMTSKGGDLGSDILASPDELALEEPRVKVEVKKRSKDKIGADDLRMFIGGLRGYHKGIYVTTSGFSKEAQYEAERSNFAITLIDSDWLVDLLVTNYDKLDPETKALVPLRKIYWPV